MIDTEASGTTNTSLEETTKIPSLRGKVTMRKKKRDLKSPTIKSTVAKNPSLIGNMTNTINLRKDVKNRENAPTNLEIGLISHGIDAKNL